MIVLLLVATLAFIALSITEKTTLAAVRSVNARAFDQNVWLAFGAESLASAALTAAVEASGGKLSIDDPWAREPLELPFENGGGARLFFADATTCFNLNSLTLSADDDAAVRTPATVKEFGLLAANLGLSPFEGEAIAEVIADWIDVDTSRLPQGAEDDYYTGLPSPYRTGNKPLVSVSEIRAMKGVSRAVYAQLKPFLCVQPAGQPSPVNINMLQPRHAPVLAALLGETVTTGQAEDLIVSRPPGGYADVNAFINAPTVQALNLDAGIFTRLAVTSRFMQARAEIYSDDAVFEVTTDFALEDSGGVKILGRRFGAEE